MDKLFLVIPLILLFPLNISGNTVHNDNFILTCLSPVQHDTIPDRQLLFNGRIWRSRYSSISGGEFLFSRDWIIGEVVINDIEFKNVPLKYDIYNDQLIAMINPGTFIQLNKELISGFALQFENRKFSFENFGNEQGSQFKGFGQILYKGKTSLILKKTKFIKPLAIQNKYDEFGEYQTLFILKDGVFYRITSKKNMLKTLSDKYIQLMSFIRTNKLKIRQKKPDSFIPVIEYYDNLK
jgi:hypothetical protein